MEIHSGIKSTNYSSLEPQTLKGDKSADKKLGAPLQGTEKWKKTLEKTIHESTLESPKSSLAAPEGTTANKDLTFGGESYLPENALTTQKEGDKKVVEKKTEETKISVAELKALYFGFHPNSKIDSKQT